MATHRSGSGESCLGAPLAVSEGVLVTGSQGDAQIATLRPSRGWMTVVPHPLSGVSGSGPR